MSLKPTSHDLMQMSERMEADYYEEEEAKTRGMITNKKPDKADFGKTRFDLLPPNSLQSVAEVFTFGAKKYTDDGWKTVENWEKRYFSAAMRHLWAWKMGEKLDPETGISHLSHAMCCLMIMFERENAP